MKVQNKSRSNDSQRDTREEGDRLDGKVNLDVELEGENLEVQDNYQQERLMNAKTTSVLMT